MDGETFFFKEKLMTCSWWDGETNLLVNRRSNLFLVVWQVSPGKIRKRCRGRDLNPRTPARQDVSSHEPFLCFDLKSCAVGHAWLPLQTIAEMKKCGRRDSNPGKRLGGPQS